MTYYGNRLFEQESDLPRIQWANKIRRQLLQEQRLEQERRRKEHEGNQIQSEMNPPTTPVLAVGKPLIKNVNGVVLLLAQAEEYVVGAKIR